VNKIKTGNIIKIKYMEKSYSVEVLKVLEMLPNGNGFITVKFPMGQIRDVSIRREMRCIT